MLRFDSPAVENTHSVGAKDAGIDRMSKEGDESGGYTVCLGFLDPVSQGSMSMEIEVVTCKYCATYLQSS